jgi:hypothetical protein
MKLATLPKIQKPADLGRFLGVSWGYSMVIFIGVPQDEDSRA